MTQADTGYVAALWFTTSGLTQTQIKISLDPSCTVACNKVTHSLFCQSLKVPLLSRSLIQSLHVCLSASRGFWVGESIFLKTYWTSRSVSPTALHLRKEKSNPWQLLNSNNNNSSIVCHRSWCILRFLPHPLSLLVRRSPSLYVVIRMCKRQREGAVLVEQYSTFCPIN